MKMKDLDDMDIERIIRLPYFYRLERELRTSEDSLSSSFWKVTFKCNRIVVGGGWQLLDMISNDEFITRYRIIDPKY